MDRPIRIVLADDHPVVRIGVSNMLTPRDGFEVVGDASDGDEAITQTLELEPDILLLDVQMPRLPGLEAMRAIMAGTPTVKILLLTSTITTQQIIEALHIGARGIVLKQSASDLLVKSIHRVYGGEIWLDNRMPAEVMKAFAKSSDGGPRRDKPLLSEREKEIVQLVAQGYRNKEIGEKLFISEQTVKNHLHNIFDKLGVSDRLELALYAIHHRLIDQS